MQLEHHERDIIKGLLKEEIKQKERKELDQQGEHMLQEKKELYRKLGGNLAKL